MFSCSASMNFHASASPHICNQPATSRKPVPDEAGLGITILPLYTGLVRSFHDSGLGSPCFPASAVLKQTAAPYTSIPTHCGGVVGVPNLGGSLSAPFCAEPRGKPPFAEPPQLH